MNPASTPTSPSKDPQVRHEQTCVSLLLLQISEISTGTRWLYCDVGPGPGRSAREQCSRVPVQGAARGVSAVSVAKQTKPETGTMLAFSFCKHGDTAFRWPRGCQHVLATAQGQLPWHRSPRPQAWGEPVIPAGRMRCCRVPGCGGPWASCENAAFGVQVRAGSGARMNHTHLHARSVWT